MGMFAAAQKLIVPPRSKGMHQARFTDVYSGPTLVGVSHWRFTANLELFKWPVVDAEWLLITPEYILMSDISDRSMNQEWPRYFEE